MPTGTVVRFDARKGFGFIKGDEDEDEYFVHQNDIVMDGFRCLYQDEEVEFESESNDKGKKALKVTVTRESPRRNGPPQRYNPNRPPRAVYKGPNKLESMLNRLLDVLAEDTGEVEAILSREDLDFIRNGGR